MEMKIRLLFVPLMLALVASLAACGGGGGAVPANDVALVKGQPISNTDFNTLLAQAVKQAVAAGQPEPKAGTACSTRRCANRSSPSSFRSPR
jgi:hypothetical protein